MYSSVFAQVQASEVYPSIVQYLVGFSGRAMHVKNKQLLNVYLEDKDLEDCFD